MTTHTRLTDEILSAMAFLHCEIQGRRESASFAAADGHGITFVFDTDVLVAYVRPNVIGPAPPSGATSDGLAPRARGYGQLLPRMPANLASKIPGAGSVNSMRLMEDGTAWQVTKALVNKAFEISRKTSGRQALRQFSTHFFETTRIRAAATSEPNPSRNAQYTTTGDQRNYERVTKILANEILRRENRLEPVADFIARRLERAVIEGFDGRSEATRESDAFRQLDAEGGVDEFDTVEFLEEVAGTFEPSPEYLALEAHATRILESFWQDRVTASKPYRSPHDPTLRGDVDALVQLAIINRRLIEAGAPHRLVFVTGDKSLVRSTYSIDGELVERFIGRFLLNEIHRGAMAPEQTSDLRRKLLSYFGVGVEYRGDTSSASWFTNFARHYVRHFWATVEEALIEADQKTDFQDLFHGLFARAGLRLVLSRRRIERIVLGHTGLIASARDRVDPEQVLLEWHRLTRKRIEQRRLKDLGFDKIGAADTTIPGGGDVAQVITEYGNRQLDRTMVDLSDHGAHEVVAMAEGHGRPVDLYFRSLVETYRIFTNIAKKNYYRENPNLFVSDFDHIAFDCFGHDKPRGALFDDRQLSHLKFLVLAATFAIQEKWAAALGHALRAISIIDRSKGPAGAFNGPIPVRPGKKSNMSGREAYYLASICHRMRASEAGAFDLASQYLKLSEAAQRADWRANEEVDLLYFEARAANERWTIALCQYYFWRAKDNQPEWEKAFRKAVELAREPSLRTFVEDAVPSPDATSAVANPLTYDAICFNYLQISLIATFWKDERLRATFAPDAHIALTWLNARANSEDYIESPLVELYRKGLPVTHALNKEGDYPRFNSSREVADVVARFGFTDAEGRRRRTSDGRRAEYDVWRIEKAQDFILSSLN